MHEHCTLLQFVPTLPMSRVHLMCANSILDKGLTYSLSYVYMYSTRFCERRVSIVCVCVCVCVRVRWDS